MGVIGLSHAVEAADARLQEGSHGWDSRVAGYYGSPDGACQAQFAVATEHFSGIYGGARPTSDPLWWECHWIGLVRPINVVFRCESGYVAVGGTSCMPAAERDSEILPDGNTPGLCSAADTVPVPNRSVGNPVELSSGRKVEAAVDFSTADGLLSISRTYVSRFGRAASLPWRTLPGAGIGWSFDQAGPHLSLNAAFGADPSMTVFMPDGSEYTLRRDATTGLFVDPNSATRDPQQSSRFTLEFLGTAPTDWSTVNSASTQWVLKDQSTNTTYTMVTFNHPGASGFRTGHATRQTLASGYYWDLSYGPDGELASLTDVFGRQMTFTWVSGFGGGTANRPVLIESIGLPDGTALKYTYAHLSPIYQNKPQHNDVLTKVEHVLDPTGTGPSNLITSTTYHYEDPAYAYLLTGITDHRGVRTATFGYDSHGRAIVSEHHAGADRHEYAYSNPNANTKVTTVTNPLGKVATYTYTKSDNYWLLTSINGATSPNCVATTQTYTYSGKLPASITDEEGRVVTYARDSAGMPTAVVRASGTGDARTTEYTWRTDRQIDLIEADGLTTDYIYDVDGRMIGVTQTDTTTHTLPYPTAGQQRSWTVSYTAHGLISAVDGPLAGTGDTISYTYDADGYLASVSDANGLVSAITSTDANGLPLTLENANGIEMVLTYTAQGQLATTAVDPEGANVVTTFTYDAIGQMTEIERADGSAYAFAYDEARRLVSITDAAGNVVKYDHDAMGGITQTTVEDATANVLYTRQNTFDELGRLLTSVGASADTWQFGYDKVSNQVTVTDPRTGVTSTAFNGLNEVVSTVDQANHSQSFERDSQGDVVVFEDGRGIETTYVRNGWGEIIAETSPDIGTVVYERNALGAVVRKTDARGVVANYSYDAGGRLTGIVYPASSGEDVAFSYDDNLAGNLGKGLLTGIVDQVGSTGRHYNSLGLLAEETVTLLGATAVTGYQYDDAGNIETLTYPSGRLVHYERDLHGRIVEVTTQSTPTDTLFTVVHSIEHQPFGEMTYMMFNNGISQWRSYDQDYRLTETSLRQGSTLLAQHSLGYGDGLNLTSIDDDLASVNDQSLSYTPNNRLASATGPWGEDTLLYDGSGNRTVHTSDTGGVATTDAYHFGASNLLQQIDRNGALHRSFTHDAAGNLVSDTAGGTTTLYTYNHAGRPAAITRNGNLVGEYTYNAFGQLVIRTVTNTPNDGITVYFYDQNGRVLAEFDGANAQLKREYIWLGDLPIAVIDPDGLGGGDTYYVHTDHIGRPLIMLDEGANIVAEATWDPFGNVVGYAGTEDLDLRFPGQLFQAETGLHYNWNRHYDPTTGRYTQPDPLGLVDAPSRFAYAASDPLQTIDPDGLQSASLPVIGPPGQWLEKPGVQWRLYDSLGNALCDVDLKSHGGSGVPHFHFWINGIRSHPGVPMSLWHAR